jgi:tripartite-type tricarboxylate transporter receptor subunit TctC
VVAPAGTSVRIIDMLNAAINAELRSDELQTILIRLGAEPKTGSPQDFAEFIAEEVPKWAKVVKSSGMKPD